MYTKRIIEIQSIDFVTSYVVNHNDVPTCVSILECNIDHDISFLVSFQVRLFEYEPKLHVVPFFLDLVPNVCQDPCYVSALILQIHLSVLATIRLQVGVVVSVCSKSPRISVSVISLFTEPQLSSPVSS